MRKPRGQGPSAGFAVLVLLMLLLASALVGLTLMWQREMTASRTQPSAPARAYTPAAQNTANAAGAVDARPASDDRPVSADAVAESGQVQAENEQDGARAPDSAAPKPEADSGRVSLKDCQWLYDHPLKACARQGDGACKTAEQDFPADDAAGVTALSNKPGFSTDGFHSACRIACLMHAKPAFDEYSRQVCGMS